MTIARRCAASCTDRTLHRFCQAFTPSASANRGQRPRIPTALQRTLFAVVTRRVSVTGASRSYPKDPVTARAGGNLPRRRRRARANLQGLTAAEPPELHVRRPNLSLDDLLRLVIKPLHVTLGGFIGCLRRF